MLALLVVPFPFVFLNLYEVIFFLISTLDRRPCPSQSSFERMGAIASHPSNATHPRDLILFCVIAICSRGNNDRCVLLLLLLLYTRFLSTSDIISTIICCNVSSSFPKTKLLLLLLLMLMLLLIQILFPMIIVLQL